MAKLKVTRVSTMPNNFSSYAYLLDEASVEILMSAAPEGKPVQGIYDGQDGGKIIYSRSRLGKTNVPMSVDFRVVEQRKDGVATGNFFANLVDGSLEELADAGAKYQAASRFGEGFAAAFANHAVASLFRKTPATPVAAPVAATPVAAGEELPQ